MDLTYLLMILFYWLFLSGVIFLAGAYISRIYVTGPSGAELCFVGTGNQCLGKNVTKYIFFISILTLLVNGAHFVLHCSVMTETPLQEVFSILPIFITKTKYGKFTIVRTIFLVAIIVVAFINVLKERKWTASSGVALSLLLLTAIAMSGHQGAKGYTNFPFFLDVLHLIAVSWWIGGIIFIRFFLSAFMKGSLKEFWLNLTSLINRFSHLATYSVFIAGITGILLTFANIDELPVLFHSRYGIILVVKILLVSIIVIIGGINKFFVVPDINTLAPDKVTEGSDKSRKLLRLVSIEAVLGFTVLLLTSLLTHLSPEG